MNESRLADTEINTGRVDDSTDIPTKRLRSQLPASLDLESTRRDLDSTRKQRRSTVRSVVIHGRSTSLPSVVDEIYLPYLELHIYLDLIASSLTHPTHPLIQTYLCHELLIGQPTPNTSLQI